MSNSAGEPQLPTDLTTLLESLVVWSDPYFSTGEIFIY